MSGTPILVVEDAPIDLKLIRLLLTHDGYEVRTAERAEDALQMLSHYRPELILADIRLPGMDGLDMTRKIKENRRTSSIRVVALTACNLKEDRERAMRVGCDDYITKPIDTSSLSVKVRELLSRPVAESTQEPPLETPIQTLTGREIDILRRRFLNEGAERSRHLLDSLGSTFDLATASRQLHQWAGTAALLEYPEISGFASHAEDLLQEEPFNTSRLRETISELYVAFEELRRSQVAPLPEPLVQAIGGKRIALAGLTPPYADALCAVLQEVKARPLLFSAADDPASAAIRECDLVIVHVRSETLDTSWFKPDSPALRDGKLVLTGERRHLLSLTPEVRSCAVELVLESEEPEDSLMRLAFALSRSKPAGPGRCSVAHEASAAAPVKARSSVARPSVLLADDDAIVLTLLESTLRNFGMSCRSVDNGLDALRLTRSEQPHVAVLDVNMPGMDGFNVLAAIRAEKLPSRVILLTARQQEREVVRAFELGADDFLTKPFNPFELVARMKRFMR